MYFVVSAPWPFKMLLFGASLLRAYAPPDGQGALDPLVFRVCFWSVAALLAAALLPSVCYSVRARRDTTALVSQTLLMLTGTALGMCWLYAHSDESRSQTCLAMLVLVTHVLYSVCRAVCSTPRLLNGGGGVCWLVGGACVVSTVVLGPRLPAQPVHPVHSVALLFAGEVLGVAVFVTSGVLRSCADGIESFCAQPGG